MDSTQTLHDFVLNLLTDPDARSAFELDPEGTLRDAGLSDLTPADVQDVVPLVVDYAPVQGITGLDSLDGLGLDSVVPDAAGVVGHLQSVAQQVSAAGAPIGVDVNAATLGAITVDPAGLGVGASFLSDLGAGVGPGGVGADISGAYDVAGTLDAEVLEPTGVDLAGAVGDPAGIVGDPVGAADGLVSGVTSGGLLGAADVTVNTVTGTVGGVTDAVGGVTDTVGSLGGLDAGGVVGLPGSVVGDLDAGVVGGVTGTVGATLDGVGVGRITGDLGVTGDAQVGGDAGVLGLTDGLL